jgi:hypothetical protein
MRRRLLAIVALVVLLVLLAPLMLDAPSSGASAGTRHAPRPCWARGQNAGGKQLARAAEMTADMIAKGNEGSYARVTPRELHRYVPSIAIHPRRAGEWAGAYVSYAAGTERSYRITVRAPNGNDFTVRNDPDAMSRTERICGSLRSW